jgi:hypothetical protein
MQDDRNGQKILAVPSAAMARLTPLITRYQKIVLAVNGLPSLSTVGNPIMNLPCLIRADCLFLLIHSTSIRLHRFLWQTLT